MNRNLLGSGISMLRNGLTRRTQEPERIALSHGETRFEVLVRRSPRALRISLRASQATGDIVLTMPRGTSLEAGLRFARTQSGWIADRLARMPQRIPFTDGAIVPVRDTPHRIVHWSRVRSPATIDRDEQGAPIMAVAGEPEFIAKRVRELLQREARRDLATAVANYAGRVGRPAGRIALRDTRSRWGSCTARGDLSFSWRLIMAPPQVLDYLAAHEVAHLVEMNHSARYWKLLREICPHTDTAEAWLKRHGAKLHRYG
jgi:predicted metal-dependent hydrolase